MAKNGEKKCRRILDVSKLNACMYYLFLLVGLVVVFQLWCFCLKIHIQELGHHYVATIA